jgi:type I restriction enzyme S subunit
MTELIRIREFLKESRVPGSPGDTAKKITVKLYGKGVFAKQQNRPGSENTMYYTRRSGQFIYSTLDFLNGAFGIIPEILDGYESTINLPCFDFIGSKVFPEWFLFYVSRHDFYARLGGLGAGTRKARRISPESFLDLEIPCPPLPEQRKIAEILSGLTKASEAVKRKIQKLRYLFSCLLDEQFPSSSDTSTSSLEDISEFITYGLTVRPKYIEKGFPMVSAGECKNGFIDFAKAKKISKNDFSQVREKTIPSEGDLLITKTGTLGRVAVVPQGAPPFTITQNVALVRLNKAEVLPEYLACYIMSPTCQREIRDKTSVLAIPDLQLGILGNFRIPTPSTDAQRDVYLRFDSIANSIAILEKKVDQIDILRNSLANELLSGRKRVSV